MNHPPVFRVYLPGSYFPLASFCILVVPFPGPVCSFLQLPLKFASVVGLPSPQYALVLCFGIKIQIISIMGTLADYTQPVFTFRSDLKSRILYSKTT